MAYRVLLPQPLLPESHDCLLDHGFEVVEGRGITEDDIIADCDAMIGHSDQQRRLALVGAGHAE